MTGVAQSGDRAPGTRPGPPLVCAELVGRAAEAAALADRVTAAGQGSGGVVVLVGDAGTGKSRLVAETTTTARAAGATVLFGRAVPGAQPVAYRPLAEALLAAFDVLLHRYSGQDDLVVGAARGDHRTRPRRRPGLQRGISGQDGRLQVLTGVAVVVTAPFARSGGSCGTTLAAGATCEIDVSFTAESPVNTFSGALK